jgi:hypothetical protein
VNSATIKRKKMKSKFFIAFSLALSLTACNQAIESPYPPISFQQETVMPGSGRASAVAL